MDRTAEVSPAYVSPRLAAAADRATAQPDLYAFNIEMARKMLALASAARLNGRRRAAASHLERVRYFRKWAMVAKANAAITYKLVDTKTGADLSLPLTGKMWDGHEITVVRFKPSKHRGNPGFIYTDKNELYVPSVVGAAIVQVSA